jgi:hypothetical protein
MKVMLDEIARKKSVAESELVELERRRAEQAEQAGQAEQECAPGTAPAATPAATPAAQGPAADDSA